MGSSARTALAGTTASLLIVALTAAATALSSASASPLPALPAAATPAPIALPEIPASVAVANSGLSLAALHDRETVAMVAPDGSLSEMQVGCKPIAVAIDPAGAWGWTICNENPHLIILDLARRATSVADIGLKDATSLAYVSAFRKLLVGDLTGAVRIIGTTSLADYAVERTVRTSGFVDGFAISATGEVAYLAPNQVSLAALDVSTGAVTPIRLKAPGAYISALSVARSGNLLYAGATYPRPGGGAALALLAIDPSSGTLRQRLDLDPTAISATPMRIFNGSASLYVTAGLGIASVAEGVTGAVTVALDPAGRMGALRALINTQQTANASALSADGQTLAVATTNANLFRLPTGDKLSVDARSTTFVCSVTLRGTQLTVSGRATGIRASSAVTVHVGDGSVDQPVFARQATSAVTDASGAFRWVGSSRLARVAAYAQAAGKRCPVVRTTRAVAPR